MTEVGQQDHKKIAYFIVVFHQNNIKCMLLIIPRSLKKNQIKTIKIDKFY